MVNEDMLTLKAPFHTSTPSPSVCDQDTDPSGAGPAPESVRPKTCISDPMERVIAFVSLFRHASLASLMRANKPLTAEI